MPDDPEQIKLLGSNAGPAEVPMNTRILTNNFYHTKDVNLPKPFSLLVSPFCPKILCLNHPLLHNVNTLGSLTKKVSLSQPFLPSLPPSSSLAGLELSASPGVLGLQGCAVTFSISNVSVSP